MENYLSIGETAKVLGVSTGTLRRWDNSGKFPSQRHPINNYRVYKKEHINSLLKNFEQKYLFKTKHPLQDQISPIFETKLGKLYNEDVIHFFKSINSSSVQLIFADPPYNIKKAEWDTFDSQKEYVKWNLE